MAGGETAKVRDTAEWELVSGGRSYAKVMQRASVEIESRFPVLSGGEKAREETVVVLDPNTRARTK